MHACRSTLEDPTAILFYYGRILGLRTSYLLTGAIAGFYLVLAGLRLAWPALNLPHLTPAELASSFFLHLLALGLILLLLKMGHGREDELLTELSRQKRSLQDSESLKARVFDWMTSGLVALDSSGAISLINAQALEWTDLEDPTQALGRPIREIFPELATLWQDRSLCYTRLEVEQASGDRVLDVTMTPTPHQEGVLFLFSDITKVRALEQRVRQMEKLATLGELSSGLAHEIKNPLAGIKGSLQLLAQDSLPRDHRERLHQVILRDIRRLDVLLQDFLAFARPSPAEARPIDLEDRVLQTLLGLRSEYPGVSLTMSPSLAGKTWHWDPDQFHQVLLNLVLNAIQAVDGRPGPEVEIGWSADQSGEHLYVLDNGPGLEPGSRSQLFDPFFTTKADGSGLGLAISQRLAEQNQAWIELRTGRDGSGAEARIYLAPEHLQGAQTA